MDETGNDQGGPARARPAATLRPEGEHPDLGRLLAYRDGELAEEEGDALQEHLSLCADCALLLLEFDQFRADAAAGERGTSDEERRAAWESLRGELRRERASESAAGLGPQAPFGSAPIPLWRAPRTAYALAAALALVALGLALAFGWSQNRHRADLAALEASRREAAELRTRLQEAQAGPNPAPAPEVRSGAPSPNDRLAVHPPQPPVVPTPRRPETLAPDPPPKPPGAQAVAATIAVAVGPWLTTRGESAPTPTLLQGGGAVNPLVPDANGKILVGFDPGAALDQPQVRVTLLDAEGRALWSSERLSAVLQGDRGTAAALTRLPPGRYRLRAEAVGGAGAVEFLLEVGAGGG